MQNTLKSKQHKTKYVLLKFPTKLKYSILNVVRSTFLNLQIIDEKSLIKKYQNEIRCLKEELEHLKRGIVTIPQLKDTGEGDIVLLKQKVLEVTKICGFVRDFMFLLFLNV